MILRATADGELSGGGTQTIRGCVTATKVAKSEPRPRPEDSLPGAQPNLSAVECGHRDRSSSRGSLGTICVSELEIQTLSRPCPPSIPAAGGCRSGSACKGRKLRQIKALLSAPPGLGLPLPAPAATPVSPRAGVRGCCMLRAPLVSSPSSPRLALPLPPSASPPSSFHPSPLSPVLHSK